MKPGNKEIVTSVFQDNPSPLGFKFFLHIMHYLASAKIFHSFFSHIETIRAVTKFSPLKAL